MEFKDLERVNKTLNKTDVKGKDYVEVNERVKAFRILYPEGTILTEIESMENGVVTIQASVYKDYEHNILLATGYAQEKENSSFINKTSYIENCETSAVGRALGFLGIGIDTSIASAEEVENAIANQTITQTQEKAIRDVIKNHDISSEKVVDLLKQRNHEKLNELTSAEYMNFYNELTKGVE